MKLTTSQVRTLISEFEADTDREHRRGSTFYLNASMEVNQEVVDYIKEFFGVDYSANLGFGLNAHGTWSDDDGIDIDGYSLSICREVLVPEEIKVIPAHVKQVWESVNEQ